MLPVTGRRAILRFLLSLPLALFLGCRPKAHPPIAEGPALSPEEALRRLILVLGPWDEGQREQAEDFARRFLAAGNAISPYLPASAATVQSLADRFPAGTLAVGEIDLASLPEEERDLLLQLTRQLYTYVEVRFFVNGEPPWGECQRDNLRYTRA
ncbi:MAG TPA: hypothetical protein VIA07_03185, partial [Desulfuromonadales bacterium]